MEINFRLPGPIFSMHLLPKNQHQFARNLYLPNYVTDYKTGGINSGDIQRLTKHFVGFITLFLRKRFLGAQDNSEE